jgi:hypothetical protein
MPSRRTFSLLLFLVCLSTGAAAQQKFQYVGPNECINCHDHQPERQWYERQEIPEVQKLFPDKGANAGHINSLKQMETPKSDEFAKAIGLADKYDLNGACVTCHATVFAGDANAGVSCESCHGPASGYLKPHQTKGAYEVSVKEYGMTPLLGNIQGWTNQCTSCHVMDDTRLIAAGHPSGDDFDLGRKFLPVSIHFKKKYAETDVGTIGRAEMAGIVARRRPGAAPIAAPEPVIPVIISPPGAPIPLFTLPPEPPPAALPPAVRVRQAPAPGAPPAAPPAVAPPAAPPAVFIPDPAVVTPPPAPLPSAPAPAPAPPAAAPPAQAPVAVTVGMGTSTFVLIGLVVLIGIGALVWFTKKKG